jgi:hypothetical protein
LKESVEHGCRFVETHPFSFLMPISIVTLILQSEIVQDAFFEERRTEPPPEEEEVNAAK